MESARVDESGHLRLKIEEEQEKDLGNIKGDKGDSITITDQQHVSEGVQLTFSDKTKVVIPKGEKGDTGDARGINLDNYATKAELKEIDVSKQLADYLSKTEAEQTYLKKSDKVELPTDLVRTGDIADLATKSELANKADNQAIVKLQASVESKLDKGTADGIYLQKDGISGIAAAKVITDVSQATDSNILYLIKG